MRLHCCLFVFFFCPQKGHRARDPLTGAGFCGINVGGAPVGLDSGGGGGGGVTGIGGGAAGCGVPNVDDVCYHYASELDTGQLSPAGKHKRSSSQLSTATATYVTQLTGGSLDDCSVVTSVGGMSKSRNHKNGCYELVDINSIGTAAAGKHGRRGDGEGDGPESPVEKRGSSNNNVHYKLASTTELWPSTNNVFNQQIKPQTANQVANSGGLRRTNTISNSITTSATSAGTGARNMRIHQQKSLSSRILSMKRENKTTQTLSIVVGGFIACWLPFFIHYLITPFLPAELRENKLGEFFTWLGWINSAINPFIYAFYSVDFRAAFWRLTFRRFFRDSDRAPFAHLHNMSMRR